MPTKPLFIQIDEADFNELKYYLDGTRTNFKDWMGKIVKSELKKFRANVVNKQWRITTYRNEYIILAESEQRAREIFENTNSNKIKIIEEVKQNAQ